MLKQLLDYIWMDKKRRTLTILVFLLVVLFGFIVRNIVISAQNSVDTRISRLCICPKCGNKEWKKFDSITEVRCSKCKSKMGFAWKCKECDFEYAVDRSIFKGKLNNEMLMLRQEECACPNCKSINTGPARK